MSDPSVSWHHHPANISELDLLADIIRYQAERMAKPHIEPQRVEWPTWARKLPIPPVKYFGNIAEFAAAMGRLVADAEFLGRDNQIPARDICDVCGAVLGELGTCPCDDEPLEITPAALKGTLDRMHAAITQDEGVAG